MRFFLFLALLFFLASCSTTRYTNPAEYPNARINFGSGGGFSGMVTEYVLLDNGQLLKKMMQADSFEMVTTVDKNQTTQLFENYKFLNIGNLQYNQPGNMYSFIHFHHENTEHKIIWPGNQYPDKDANLKIFYKNLKSLIPVSK